MTYLPNLNLDYSRPLDVHRWSNYPEVNSFIDKIYCSLPSLPGNKMTRKKHLKVLLLDLYVAWTTDPDLKIAISRDNNAYKAKSRYNELHISKVMPAVVNLLVEAGLVYHHDGFFDHETRVGRVSRVWATEKLAEEFKAAVHLRFGISQHEDRETVILRDEEKQEVEYEDTKQTTAMRTLLKRYNDLLAKTHIDLDYLEQPVLKFKNTKAPPLQITQADKFVRRIFNNGRWDQGGRFYGGWWQRCPKEQRTRICFNGFVTQEVDFSGLHIVLLYAQKGIDYWATIGEDPYLVDWPKGVDQSIDKRAAVKRLFLVAINAKDEKATFKGFRSQCDKGTPEKRLKDKELEEVLASIKAKHKPIADKIASGAGIDLMYLDSQITERIIKFFTEREIPMLSIHDSYVVPFGHDNALMREMQAAFFALTNVQNVRLTHTTLNSEDYWWPEKCAPDATSDHVDTFGEPSLRHKNDVALFARFHNLPSGPPEWLATWTAVY